MDSAPQKYLGLEWEELTEVVGVGGGGDHTCCIGVLERILFSKKQVINIASTELSYGRTS
jgi:hypothetical protein